MSVNFYKLVKNVFLVILGIFLSTASFAQGLSGTLTIDPAGSGASNYTTFKAAIDSLNSKGVGSGGVTFNVAAGATFNETGRLLLTATGTAANPIVFQKSGVGASPIIVPAAGIIAAPGTLGSSRGDAALTIYGSDYVTIDGLTFQDNVAYTGAQKTDYGIFLAKTATNACKNVTIKNNTVTLDRTVTNSIGIFLSNTDTAGAGQTVTARTGRSENITIQNNTVYNVHSGIYTNGYGDFTLPYQFLDHFITIRDNSVTGFGNNSSQHYGIFTTNVDSLKVIKNVINNNATVAVTASNTGSVTGLIFSSGTNSQFNIDSNTVTLVTSRTSNTLIGISIVGGGSGINNICTAIGNTIQNVSSPLMTTGTTTMFNSSGGVYNYTIRGNVIKNNSFGGGTGGTATATINYMALSGTNTTAGSIWNVYDNLLTGNDRLQTTAGSATTNFISITSSGLVSNIYNNTVRKNTTGTSTGTTTMLLSSNTGDVKNIYNNTLDSLYNNPGATYGGAFIGLSNSAGTLANIYNNKITTLVGGGLSSATMTGMVLSGGTTINTYNNTVSDLRAAATSGTNQFIGATISGGTTQNFRHNSIFLNSTSTGAILGTTGINITSTTPIVTLQNNIVVNKSTQTGTTGYASAVRHNFTTLTSVSTSNNGNIYYSGTPSARRVIFYNGTNADTTIVQYRSRMYPRETASGTEDVPFVNTTTVPYDLHINPATGTKVESGGVAVASITTDIDGNARNANFPDVGADEGAFTAATDVVGPVIAFTPFKNASLAATRSVTDVSILDPSGVNVSAGSKPRIYYRKKSNASVDNAYNGNTNATPGWKYTEATNAVTPFAFTIDYALCNPTIVTGDTLEYFFAAQDLAVTPNVGINSAVIASAAATVDLQAVNFPVTGTLNSYIVAAAIPAAVTVGTGGTYPSISGPGGLFAAVNAGVMTQNVTASIVSNLAETGANELREYTEEGVGGYRLSIVPSAAAIDSIIGSFAGGMIRLRQADRVTIDGSFLGTGRYLVFVNNNTGTSSVIQLYDAATSNGCTDVQIKNSVIIGGASGTGVYGVSLNGNSIGSSGNNHDNVTIEGNEIKRVHFGIWVGGTLSLNGVNGLLNGLRIKNNEIGSVESTNYIRFNGIQVTGADGAKITGNRIYNILTTTTNPTGIIINGADFINSMISGNNINEIKYTGTGGYTGKGITFPANRASAFDTIANNFISNLKGDGWNSLTGDGAVGIRMLGTGSNYYIYNNTINLNSTTNRNGENHHAAMYFASSVTGLDIRNNVMSCTIINRNATGTFKTWGLVLAGAASQVTQLNNNIYYINAGVAGTSSFAGAIGAVNYNDFASFATATGKDLNSFTEQPVFVDSADLHIASGANPTLLESNGATIAGLNYDYDGNLRPGPVGSTQGGAVAFDIGADEFDGVRNLGDIAAPVITFNKNTGINPPSGACVPVAHVITASFVDPSGIDTAMIRYSVNKIAQTPVIMSPIGGGLFSGTIPAAPANQTVDFTFYGRDASVNGNKINAPGGSYIDATFFVDAIVVGKDTIAAGSKVQLDANLPSAEKTFGTGTLTTTGMPNPYYTTFWANKCQFLFTAAELSAQGFIAGPITTLGLEVLAKTTTMNLDNFTISMKHTTATALTTTYITGLTQVYTTPSYVIQSPAINTHIFQTPFQWDGVSNVVIETCFNNSNWNGSQTVKYSTTPHVSGVYYYADAAGVCASTVTGIGTSSNRPNFILGQPVSVTLNWTSSTGGNVLTPTIRNPLAQPTTGAGTYKYVLSGNNGTCTVLDSVNVVVVPAVKPVVSFTSDTLFASAGVSNVVTFTDHSTNFPDKWKWVFSPNTVAYETGYTDSSRNTKVKFTAAGLYTVKLIASNGAGKDSLVRTSYITVTLKYCTPQISFTTNYGRISGVKLKTLNNASGTPAGIPYYTNYADSINVAIPSLLPGNKDTLTVTVPPSSFTLTGISATAWIDYNVNGELETSEILASVPVTLSTTATATYQLPFKTPFVSTPGNTRLRVRVSYNASNPPKACETVSYGESEDYTVNILPAPLMTLTSTDVVQDSIPVLPGATNDIIVKIPVITNGYTNTLVATNFALSGTGTTNFADITSTKLYYTGNSKTFAPTTLFGSGTASASFSIAGNQLLLPDTNYFWLTYDIAAGATIGNNLDASCSAITISGTPSTPLITSPVGNKQINVYALVTGAEARQPYNAVPVYSGTVTNVIVGGKVTVGTGVNPTATRVRFRSTGTTALGDILNAKVFFTGSDSNFLAINQFGAVNNSLTDTITFNGSRTLKPGVNHFWLTYDVAGGAPNLNVIDGEFIDVTVQGARTTATVKAITGGRIVKDFPFSTCISAATSPDDEDLGQLTVGNFVNNTGANNIAPNNNAASTELYNNFTGLLGMKAQKEIPQTIEIKIINKVVNTYNTTVNAFIDYNRNGVFDLPGERAYKGFSPQGSSRTVAGTFTVPITALTGYTIMRVVVTEVTVADSTLPPCATYTWGETEDYQINILPPPPGDYYPPNIASVTLTPDSQCTAVSHNITALVSDTTGVDSVWISWKRNGATQPQILMTHGVGASYSGTIPPQGRATISFNIKAKDNSARKNVANSASRIYQDEYFYVSAGNDKYVGAGQTATLSANTTLDRPFRISEFNFFNYTGGCGSNGSNCTWPSYLPTLMYDDNLEISNLSSAAANLSGFKIQLEGASSASFTFPAGSIVQPGGVAVVNFNSGTTDIANAVFASGMGFFPGSGTSMGFILMDPTGVIVDAVATNAYTFTSANGVTSGDWSGSGVTSPSGIAGATLQGSDLNSNSNWVTGSPATPVSIGFTNPGLPTLPSGSTITWTGGVLTAPVVGGQITTPVHPTLGVYTYVATSSNGICTSRDTVLVNAIAPPTVDIGPATGSICGTSARTLDAGNPGASYVWSFNGSPFGTTRTVIAANPGKYKVIVSNEAKLTATDSIDLVSVPAFVYSLGADRDLCTGGTITLDAGSHTAYLWSTGATTRTISVNTIGTYSVSVLNAGGCVGEDTITVISVAPGTVNLGTDQSICASSPVTLDAGNPGSTYLWSTGATTKTIQAGLAGSYSVIVNTLSGCTLMDTVVITNKVAPTVSLGPDASICPGTTTVLDAGNAGASFLWSTGATTKTITVNAAGTYIVQVTNAGGCAAKDTIVITGKAAPTVNLGVDRDICTSDLITLDAGNVGSTYLWSTGATTQTISVNLAGTYSVQVTNVGGCVASDAMVVTNKAIPNASYTTQVVDTSKGQQVKFNAVQIAGNSYNWNFGDPSSPSNTSSLATPTHLFSTPGQYFVTLTVTNVSTGCISVNVDTIQVTGLGNDFAKIFRLIAAPNPFAGNTKINYILPTDANVTLEVYDMIGRKVNTIATSEFQAAGKHEYDFTNTDNQNASGVYMIRLIVEGKVAILRVIDIANR